LEIFSKVLKLPHGTNYVTVIEEVIDARIGRAVNPIACTVHDISSVVDSVRKA
jgi:hypothetical protein